MRRTRSTTDHTALEWLRTRKGMFRALSLLWLLLVMLTFQHRGAVIKHHFISNSFSSEQQQCDDDAASNSSSEQQQYVDPISKFSSISERQPPSPLRTRPSQSYMINAVGFAELTSRMGQQEQQLPRLQDPKYDDNFLWPRRMLQGYGTPSSPSDMNHGGRPSWR
ncbi:unnamed protein product [Calypogeia fissa]